MTQLSENSNRRRETMAKPRPRRRALSRNVGGQAANQDGDEDDVVYAEDDFQGGQHRKGDPDIGVEQEFHEGRSEAFSERKKATQKAKPTKITLAGAQVNANFSREAFSKN
jgi:hypothetical protein